MSTQTPTETVACTDCGTAFERPKHYTCRPDRCEECHEQHMIEQLRRCTDPDHDGTFTRPDALQRLKNEYGQMPIVDYDGGLIQQLVVETHPGGGGAYIEGITKITECPECGFGKATYSFTANAGHHHIRVWDCPSCGFYENNA